MADPRMNGGAGFNCNSGIGVILKMMDQTGGITGNKAKPPARRSHQQHGLQRWVCRSTKARGFPVSILCPADNYPQSLVRHYPFPIYKGLRDLVMGKPLTYQALGMSRH